jgi:UDP:flavonoid glycosyltransferase YjiC (YdhE family)
MRTKVLFVVESVTLAHVARSAVLASALDPAVYDVHFACAPQYQFVLDKLTLRRLPVRSISSEAFLDALRQGRRFYDRATLRAYLREEQALLDAVRPDVVVGDFRLSLAISARLAGVSYATLTNAYWSPHAATHDVVPEHPLIHWLGLGVGGRLVDLFKPLVMRSMTRPFDALRREHGMAPFASLFDLYTSADRTFFLDVPALVGTSAPAATHTYLGPVLWSPDAPRPVWWDRLPGDRPIVYVSLGSSGPARLLQPWLDSLARAPYSFIVATAGRAALTSTPKNVWAAEYLNGEAAARRADVVVCNGGSPSVYQALAVGCPVIGVPSNMDQHLCMDHVVRAGLGAIVRSDQASATALLGGVEAVLADPGYRARAQRASAAIAEYPAPRRFAESLADWIAPRRAVVASGADHGTV